MMIRSTLRRSLSTIAVGGRIPSATLVEKVGTKVETSELFKGKKVVVFGVPGAFTPSCSSTHLPGFIAAADDLKKKGVAEIVCISVNDPFVHQAWGDAHKAGGKVRMLADPAADFSKKLGLSFEAAVFGPTPRSVRYSAVVDDGVVTILNVEPDKTGITCSLAPSIIDALRKK